MGEEKTPHTVKVVDRRRFTAEGVLRDDEPCEVNSSPDSASSPPAEHSPEEPKPAVSPRPESSQSTSEPGSSAPSGGDQAAATSPEFVELVIMLAHQAELLLVGAEGLPAQPDEARRLIDCLGALHVKTAGNLSTEEEQVITDVLFQLRTVFVQSPQ